MASVSGTWVIDRGTLLDAAELDAKERLQFDKGVDELLGAVIKVVPPERTETGDVHAAPSAAPHLLIPGTKYHLNLTGTMKATLTAAVGIIAKGFVLERAKLIETGITFTAAGIHTALTNLTRLSDRQMLAVKAVLDIVRAKKLPNYHPSTKEVAKQLGWKPAEVDAALRPLINKVVQFDEGTKGWSVVF